ncbi:MAG: hypothetical protein R3321_13800 [Nitrososphaeraceae archaeon]|nr:hypothetical protein [Nitrososphaeraceae archaeon]
MNLKLSLDNFEFFDNTINAICRKCKTRITGFTKDGLTMKESIKFIKSLGNTPQFFICRSCSEGENKGG